MLLVDIVRTNMIKMKYPIIICEFTNNLKYDGLFKNIINKIIGGLMQKRIRIVSIGIILIILLISIIVLNNNTNNKHTFKKDGILYALSLDGKSITSFPSKGLYKANVSCEGADGKWLYDDWKLAIENITGDVSCDIKFETITKTCLNDYITGLAGTTQGTGEVVNENGYRYEGKNPNNYVWFNNEYWRIIGVFDSASHGVSGKNLIKIIRADVLDGLAWHKSNTNDWTAASLNLLLNGAYYNAQDGTNSGYCYGYSTTVTANCDYTKKGIQSGYRSMIAKVTWYLGGYSSRDATAESFYGYERGTTVYSGRPTSTTGYIGLMYLSDYGYSVLASSCARTTNLSSYSSTCVEQNWLNKNILDWTITPDSSSSDYVFYLGSNDFAYFSHSVRPVLYLDSSVYVIDGDGSLDKPYIIGM